MLSLLKLSLKVWKGKLRRSRRPFQFLRLKTILKLAADERKGGSDLLHLLAGCLELTLPRHCKVSHWMLGRSHRLLHLKASAWTCKSLCLSGSLSPCCCATFSASRSSCCACRICTTSMSCCSCCLKLCCVADAAFSVSCVLQICCLVCCTASSRNCRSAWTWATFPGKFERSNKSLWPVVAFDGRIDISQGRVLYVQGAQPHIPSQHTGSE